MRIGVRLQLAFKDMTPHCEELFYLETLAIPDSAPKVVIVNGRSVKPNREIVEDDQLVLFSPVAGG